MAKKKIRKIAPEITTPDPIEVEVTVINTANRGIWTDQGRLAPGEFGQCGQTVADKLVEGGFVEVVRESIDDD